MIRPAMALPVHARLRPLEVVMLLLGMMTWSGLAVLWFRMLPAILEARGIELAGASPAARLVAHLGFQIPVLVAVMVLLAAGAAARVSQGSRRASQVIAGGCGLAFGALLLTVNSFYGVLFAGADAEPAGEEPAVDGPVDWGE